MHEVDVEPVDRGDELREAVEQSLALPPVVAVGPVAADILDPLPRHALAPVVDQLGFRPACAAQPRFQIVQDIVGYGDGEGLDGGELNHDTACSTGGVHG
jgi:hypothetical protein